MIDDEKFENKIPVISGKRGDDFHLRALKVKNVLSERDLNGDIRKTGVDSEVNEQLSLP